MRQADHLLTATIPSTTTTTTTSSSSSSFMTSFMSDEEQEEEEEEEEEEGSSEQAAAVELPPSDAAMSLIKEGVRFPTTFNGTNVRVGIIMARWNADVIQGLYNGVNESLTACGVPTHNIFVTYVPGSFELPITAKFLAQSRRFDVILCLGCLIKGDTMHFEYIAQTTAQGIMDVALDTNVPVIFGVLTVLNKEQAVVRSTGKTNEGLSWGKSAVEMGLARRSALGLDGQNQQREDDEQTTSAFVNFHPDPVPKGNGKNEKEEEEKKKKVSRKKPFGF